MRIAIVGAGIAGLACGRALAGHDVMVFDKGRGPGGRMSTRRVTLGDKTVHFDHGAQYFTARDDSFRALVDEWERAGIAARWPAAGSEAFVGTPSMNAPVKALAERADVRFATKVHGVERRGASWHLVGDGIPDTPYDALVLAVPAEQAAPLLEDHASEFADCARRTTSSPCWTVMAAFAEPLPYGDILRDAGPIGWAARNNAKPGRGEEECWVVQAGPDWSEAHLEDDPADVAETLMALFRERTGATVRPEYLAAHRWRYARSGSANRYFLLDGETRLGVCGDWMLGPRVENGFVSGDRLGRALGEILG